MFSIDYWHSVLYYVDMHVARARWPSSNGKTYESIYLRESFRQDGKVKKRDIANLTHCDPAEIAAIELALKLEQEGYIRSRWGTSENNRKAKFYELTKAGQRRVRKAAAEWEQTTEILARFLAPAEEV